MSGDDLLITSDDFGANSSRGSSPSPIPQTDIESELVRLCRLLEEHTDRMVKAAGDAAFYDAEFDIEFALALGRQHTGTVDDKKAKATIEVADLLRKKKRSAAVLTALREAGHNVRAELDALRSVNANHRSQL
jgi:hypothetical protein